MNTAIKEESLSPSVPAVWAGGLESPAASKAFVQDATYLHNR